MTWPSRSHPICCVFQLLKSHYSRYSLEQVPTITGTPIEDLKSVYEAYASTGVRDRAGAILYALGWTQHTVGVQNIRAMSMIQLLLGNMGVCRGGVNALRGAPNVQGSRITPFFTTSCPATCPRRGRPWKAWPIIRLGGGSGRTG